MEERVLFLRRKANKLPMLPGVYIMKNTSGAVIYVGKAKKLKNRVVQYFRSDVNHTEKVRKMVQNVSDFDYIVCDTEFEALTLENSLIKQYSPKYNILLKDDKGYHYIKISNEKWRRITAVKQLDNTSNFIGPYNSAYVVNNSVKEALKIFKLPDCNRNFEKRTKPCLNYHIGQCMAPCKGNVSICDYNEAVNSALDFIKSGSSENSAQIKAKMEKAAEELNFEYAARLRDRLAAIERVHEKQKVVSSDTVRQDVFALSLAGDTACVQTFIFKNGHLSDEKHYIFDSVGNKEEFYSEFLLQYYSLYKEIPKRIIIDVLPDDEVILNWLTSEAGYKVEIVVPQKGDKLKLLKMCASNASEHLAQKIERNIKETSALQELSKLLGMEKPPRYIEAYDISNISGSENVAAMVVYRDGRPEKSNYRRFKINTFVGQDDFRSMAEVLDRRFTEYEKGEDAAFSVLPDLILLDGGTPQLRAAIPIFEKHGINVPMFGMVKDSNHRTNAITAGGGSIAIKANRAVFSFITGIQDEVHRFAIGYHKARRTKSMLESKLFEIDGIGKEKAKRLIKHFKTLEKIKNADISDLIQVEGIGQKQAEAIIEYFSK